MPVTSEPIQGYAPISGAQIFFEVSGQGEPLLLIHAGVADSRMWDAQAARWAESRRVIRCDMRGFGLSAHAPGAFTFHDDLAELLRSLGVARADVVGASFGGAVALDLTLAHPELVGRLVLVAPALGGYVFETPAMREFFAQENALLAADDVDGAVELNMRMWVDGVGRDAGLVPPEIRAKVAEMQRLAFVLPPADGEDALDLEPPAIERLGDIAQPTLVMVGTNDQAEFRTIAKLVAQHIGNARYEEVVGAAHMISMEQPDTFARLVEQFLA